MVEEIIRQKMLPSICTISDFDTTSRFRISQGCRFGTMAPKTAPETLYLRQLLFLQRQTFQWLIGKGSSLVFGQEYERLRVSLAASITRTNNVQCYCTHPREC